MLLFLDAKGDSIEGGVTKLTDLYEQAFFTTFQLKNKKIPLWDFHLNRLARSAHFYSLKIDDQIYKKILNKLKIINEDSRVRITFSFAQGTELNIIIEIQKFWVEEKNQLKLKTISKKSGSFPSFVKWGNYKKAFEERAELQKTGFDDFLFWDEIDRRILESTVSNILYCQKGRWYTPALGPGVLEGSTRFALIESGIIEEKDLPLDNLAECTSMFMVNAIKEIVAVEFIDDRKLFIDQEMLQLCSTKLHDKMWSTAIDL